jgi:uncharacterized repeat protein (TIGR02543 family)
VNQYTITFNTNGGDIISTQTHTFGSPLVIPTPTRVGHAFGGWFIDSNLTQPYSGSTIAMPAENLTLYAKWTINQYTITFNTNGGDIISTQTHTFGSPLVIPTPTRVGHVFGGWFTDSNLTQSYSESETMPAENLTLYAKWNVNQYTITFNTNGGDIISTQTHTFGSPLVIPTPTRVGHAFGGWFTDSNLTQSYSESETMPAENLTLYAKWNTIIISISAGLYHSLAVTSQGRMYTWGANWYGQLGDGTANSRTTPTLINVPSLQSGETIAQVTAGDSHSLAVTTQGRVYAWGANWYGQLGDGTANSRTTPTLINVPNLQSGETIAHISAGSIHSLAVTSQGRMYAWGYNRSGQLGDGTYNDRSTPTLINVPNLQSGETIAQVTAGDVHSLAVTTRGRVYAWGWNGYGQLGDGTYNDQSTPTLINVHNLQSGESMAHISAGSYHSLAVTTQGRVYAWGWNDGYGQLGDGTYNDRLTPTLINVPNLQSGESMAHISAGSYHSLAVTTQGRVYAWGWNGYGQLGDGTTTSRNTPTLINVPNLQSGETIAQVTAGSVHSLAVTTQGRVYAWGYNVYGQLGNGTINSRTIPKLLDNL